MSSSSKYFRTKRYSVASSDESTSGSSSEENERTQLFLLNLNQSGSLSLISENFDKILAQIDSPKRPIHNRITKIWSIVVQARSSLVAPIKWVSLFDAFRDISLWSKAYLHKDSAGIALPTILRLFYDISLIVDCLLSTKNYYKKEINQKESKHFLLVSKLLKKFEIDFADFLSFYSEIEWPFKNTSSSIRLQIEECMIFSLKGVLSLRGLELKRIPDEVIEFNRILDYYKKFTNTKGSIQQLYPASTEFISVLDLSFNRISTISDPKNRLTQFSGLQFLNLYGNPIRQISPSILSSLNLYYILSGSIKATRASSRSLTKKDIRAKNSSNRLPPSLFKLAFEKSFIATNHTDWLDLPLRLAFLLRNGVLCEGCDLLFVDMRETPATNSTSLVFEKSDLDFHSSYVENHFFKWEPQNFSIDKSIDQVFVLNHLPLRRKFCFNCFLTHSMNATLTRTGDQPICPCVTCLRSRRRPLDQNQHQYPLTGLTVSSLTFLKNILTLHSMDN